MLIQEFVLISLIGVNYGVILNLETQACNFLKTIQKEANLM